MNGDPLDELEEAWAEVKRLESEVACARACADIMLQGTGQKIGEELARRVMDQHSPPQWIPVSERLPEPDDMGNPIGVLACLPDGEVCIGFCDNDEYGVRWQCQSTKNPTHWMPLPEPPEVK